MYIRYIFIFIILILSFSCLHQEVYYYGPQTMLPGTTKDMSTAGFWISRHPAPDILILSKDDITSFNNDVRENNDYVRQITELDTAAGDDVKKHVQLIHNYITGMKLYFTNNKRVPKTYYDDLMEQINSGAVPEEITVEFGIINHSTTQKLIPVNEQLIDVPGELFFDITRISTLDTGTPVAIIHESRDKQWVLTHGPISSGWVEKKDISPCSREELKTYTENESFVIVTDVKCEIFLDDTLTGYYDYCRMGNKLPYAHMDENVVEILIPRINDGDNSFQTITAYVKRDKISVGYLDYTPRTIIEQAVKYLNTPYGWGGMFGEQDCSKYIWSVFATTGLILPRNSARQTLAGVNLAKFTSDTANEEKLSIINDQAMPGITLFSFPGHIMLYIGHYNDTPYVIHDVWGYRNKIKGIERLIAINKVAISDLSPGENSKKGSFLSRLRYLNYILPPFEDSTDDSE